MKNRDLINSVESINAVAALKQLPIPVAFAVGLNLKAVRDHMEIFETHRKKILEAHTKKDDKGVPVPVYLPEKDADGKPRLDAKGDVLIVKDDKGEIVNKIHEGQVKLDDPKTFNKEIEELLNIDITDDLKIRKVRLSTLLPSKDIKDDKGTTLEPSHFANLLWMFIDDISGEAVEEKPEPRSGKKAKA